MTILKTGRNDVKLETVSAERMQRINVQMSEVWAWGADFIHNREGGGAATDARVENAFSPNGSLTCLHVLKAEWMMLFFEKQSNGQ